MKRTYSLHTSRLFSGQYCRARLLVAVLTLWMLADIVLAQQKVLRVGVYQNPPKVLLDETGQISGILGDFLTAMAQRENWTLETVPCIWNQCLEWLEDGHIDLMPDIAFSETRAQRFDFHRMPALLSWSRIYQAPGQKLTSLEHLDGKRVAILEGSIQQTYLLRLTKSFGLDVEWVTVASLDQGFAAVEDGRADAIATNNFYGDTKIKTHNLTASPILFQPIELFYATTAGRHSEVLTAIDHYLRSWREEPESPYFQSLYRWGLEPRRGGILPWVWWSIAGLAIALLLALAFTWLLRRKVTESTRSLRASEARLNTILSSVDANIYIKGSDLRYQYANRKLCSFLGVSQKEIVGQTDEAYFDPDTCAALRANDLRVLQQGERFADEEHSRIASDGTERLFLSVKLPLRHSNGEVYALCGISTDITEYREIQDQLHQLAYFDTLTGLANRSLFLDRLQHALAGYAKTSYEGALLLIDLDDFKTINDTLGHQAGDQLLRQAARRLEDNLRSTDSAGRLGADEFVMILEDLSSDPGKAIMEARDLGMRLLEILSRPYELGDGRHGSSASIGVAMFSDTNGDGEALLKGADLALHAAKSVGRNTLRFFNPRMQIEVSHRTRVEAALRKALETEQLELHVQPQVDSEGHILAMEALLRWPNSELGPISPGEFIPIAETSGLIVPLGEWVMRRACDILADWSKHPALAHLTLAVNISPEQFRHPHFIAVLKDCLVEKGVDAKYLELEVTENLLITDMDATVERMQELRSLGVRFSLDDFGTGYASLTYLKLLPLYQLKIDQSFVRDLLTDSNDEAIVRTIIALGQSLDLRVVAEGVETAEQAQRLKQLGCENFQGYFYGRPDAMAVWQTHPLLNQTSLPGS